jgi:hypothetical protein
MNRYGLFQNCCNSTENAAAAKRHNTTIEPAEGAAVKRVEDSRAAGRAARQNARAVYGP